MGDTRVPALGMTRSARPCSAGTGPVSRHHRKPGQFLVWAGARGRDRRDRPGPVEIREKPGPGPPGNADLDSVARNTLI